MMERRRWAAAAMAIGVMAAGASCSSYRRDFDAAVAEAGGVFESPSGPWEGRWVSEANGHEGPLWCLVAPSEEVDGHYDFRYRAGWGIFRFGDFTHTVPVDERPDGSLAVSGAMDLPKFVGTYSLEGTVTDDTFDARYDSTKGDHGVMTLRRPD